MAVSVGPKRGHSRFTFDLGGSLETWPYGEDPTDEQWIIHRGTETFAYRADGHYSHSPSESLPEENLVAARLNVVSTIADIRALASLNL